MSKFAKVAGSVAAVCLTAATAVQSQVRADGLGPRGSVKDAPIAAPVFRWTGFYVGVNAGYDNSTKNIYNTGTDTGGGGLGSALNAGAIPRSIGLGSHGGVGGVQAGYNWQTGTLVYGLEVDFQWLDADKRFAAAPVIGGFVPITTSVSRDTDWLGTARARLGITLAPEFLIYATGGLAFGEGNTRLGTFAPLASPPINSTVRREHDMGWAAGGGMEWAFTRNWSVKGEYLYYNMGDKRAVQTYTYGASTSSLTSRWKDDGSMARFGVNYRF